MQSEYDNLGQSSGECGSECDFYEPTLGHIEDLVEYERGGDTFADGRYRVVHKLGYGGKHTHFKASKKLILLTQLTSRLISEICRAFADSTFYSGSSTVWLARDTQFERYVALKILSAHSPDELCDFGILDVLKAKRSTHKSRQYVSFLYDHFTIEGPNGSHLCLVSEVLGPSRFELIDHRKQLRRIVARKVGKQFVQAVAYLHSEGVCHGDLIAANIAFQLHNFDAWSEEELYLRLGEPKTEVIQTVSGQTVPKSAPNYVVQPASFTDGGSHWVRDDICIMDFGISFFAHDPPKDLGTPPSFTAPEAWFEMAAGKNTDLWAIGCMLYILRSGLTLIQSTWGGTPLEVISEIRLFLGPLPERWDRLWFDEEGMPQSREEMAGNETPSQWRNEGDKQPQSLQDLVMHITDEYHEIEAKGGKVMYPPEKPKQPISSAEAACFADLLGKILRWEPTERASAEIVADHSWFHTEFPDVQTAEDAPNLFQS